MVVAVETLEAPIGTVNGIDDHSNQESEPEPEKTASQQVREWTKKRLDGQTHVKAPALAAAALAEIGTDELLLKLGRAQFYRIVLEVIGDTRTGHSGLRRNGNGSALTPDELKAKWQNYLEHAGEQHVSVTSLTYEDILLVVAERRKQVAPELAAIEFLVNLGKKVKGTNLTVGEKLTPKEIEAIRQAANEKYKVVP